MTWKTCSGPEASPAPSRPVCRADRRRHRQHPARAYLPGIAQWSRRVLAGESPLQYDIADLAEIGPPFPGEPLKPALRDCRHEHTKAWSTLLSGYRGIMLTVTQRQAGASGIPT